MYVRPDRIYFLRKIEYFSEDGIDIRWLQDHIIEPDALLEAAVEWLKAKAAKD